MAEISTGLLRHALQLVGGALIARGFVDPTGWDLIVGAATSVAAAGWYLLGRMRARR